MTDIYAEKSGVKVCKAIRICVAHQHSYFNDVCSILRLGQTMFHHASACIRETRFLYSEPHTCLSMAMTYQNQNYATNMWRIAHDQRNRRWNY